MEADPSINSGATPEAGVAALVVPIESVGKEWKRLLKSFHVGPAAAILVLLLFLPVVVKQDWAGAVSFMSFVGLMATAVFVAFVYLRAEVDFTRKFALANDFKFDIRSIRIDKQPGLLFAWGHSKKISIVVSGAFLGQNFRYYKYSFATGSGKSQTHYEYAVFEIKLDAILPDIVLADSGFNWAESAMADFLGNRSRTYPKIVPLEKEWEKEFDLRAPEDYEIEAMQLFDPAALREFSFARGKAGLGASIELVEDRAYIYVRHVIRDGKRLRGMFLLAEFLISTSLPKIDRMKRGFEAQREVFTRSTVR